MYLPDVKLLEQWVSPERLTKYFAAREDTPALSLWNAALSSAYFEVIGHAEILLRNVFHSRLAPLTADRRWYVDPRYPFTDQSRRDVRTAITRATKDKTPEVPGKVVAELSFGFWRFMLSGKYASTVWPTVAPGFKGVPRHERHREQLEQAATRVNGLRNRIAHHEPVFHLPVEQNLADVLLIARYVDERAERMVTDASRIHDVLAQRPNI